MAERLIGSLIYGDHPEPRKARPWKDRIKVPLAFALLFIVGGGIVYRFINYREEARVQMFLDAVREQRFDNAYAMWDGGERYDMARFLEDWGQSAYYTTGSMLEVVDSNNNGGSIIVYVSVHPDDEYPTAIRVDKVSMKLSFSPTNKHIDTAIYGPPN